MTERNADNWEYLSMQFECWCAPVAIDFKFAVLCAAEKTEGKINYTEKHCCTILCFQLK